MPHRHTLGFCCLGLAREWVAEPAGSLALGGGRLIGDIIHGHSGARLITRRGRRGASWFPAAQKPPKQQVRPCKQYFLSRYTTWEDNFVPAHVKHTACKQRARVWADTRPGKHVARVRRGGRRGVLGSSAWAGVAGSSAEAGRKHILSAWGLRLVHPATFMVRLASTAHKESTSPG